MRPWDALVDAATVVWLSAFTVGMMYEKYSGVTDTINLSLLPVFVADLYVGYRRMGNFRKFLRDGWLDVLAVIPFLRVLRVIRAARILRLARARRVEKALKALKKAQRLAQRRTVK